MYMISGSSDVIIRLAGTISCHAGVRVETLKINSQCMHDLLDLDLSLQSHYNISDYFPIFKLP